MGVHTGEPVLVAYGYTGEAVHQAARLCAAARGGEVLVSQATHDALASAPAPEVELRDLGRAASAGGAGAERVFQVVAPGLPDVAPPRLEALRGV
jgi:class 3 adenylate cyclase